MILKDDYKTFHVGVNAIVIKDGEILLGKRKNIFGSGTWGLPGGHLETEESMAEAAKRELLEETSLIAGNVTFSNLINSFSKNEHRLQVGFLATDVKGDVKLTEPDRCKEWKWFKTNELPDNVFPPHIKQIENFLNKIKFLDE